MDGLLTNGTTIFHRLLALYTRRIDGSLAESSSEELQENWTKFRSLQSQHDEVARQSVCLPFGLRRGDVVSENQPDVLVLERWDNSKQFIVGMLIKPSSDQGGFHKHDDQIADMILRSTHVTASLAQPPTPALNLEDIEDQIITLFDTTVRNITPNDQWMIRGRQFFLERLRHFTRKGEMLEFALPAFPCKSSNLQKVGGKLPDRAEMIALTSLHTFVRRIEQLYNPGARVWIVSDGHVFSDCIGVDDSIVDMYGQHLREMNKVVEDTMQDNGRHRVCFQSLPEMLHLTGNDIEGQTLAERLGLDQTKHHIERVQVNDDAELCRRLLVQEFGADSTRLRARIDAQDPTVLALYRGFSRFMLEDLECNTYTQHLSKSQRRKLSSKIALQMIERNQAYSNLVEMVFPYHIRLSIHAHNNAGPKFGINLMGPRVRAVRTLPPDDTCLESHDLLHVPTPWHGCIAEISGHEHLYLVRAERARAAIEQKDILGAWVAPAVNSNNLDQHCGQRKDSAKSSPVLGPETLNTSMAFFSLMLVGAEQWTDY